MDLIENWAALENDLEAQASLVRDDRVQIGGASDKRIKLRISSQIMRYDTSRVLGRNLKWSSGLKTPWFESMEMPQ